MTSLAPLGPSLARSLPAWWTACYASNISAAPLSAAASFPKTCAFESSIKPTGR
jgi:hypothetical protein